MHRTGLSEVFAVCRAKRFGNPQKLKIGITFFKSLRICLGKDIYLQSYPAVATALNGTRLSQKPPPPKSPDNLFSRFLAEANRKASTYSVATRYKG
jgi:hypothetical protein